MVPSVATEKSPTTPLGIDPATLRLITQCLNHYATPGSRVELSPTITVYAYDGLGGRGSAKKEVENTYIH